MRLTLMINIVETTDYNLLARLNEEIQTLHNVLLPKIFKPYEQEAVIGFFKTSLNNENATAFVAFENDAPVGYVLLFIMNIPSNPFQYSRSYILIDQISVLQKYRGKGIGKQLLGASYAFAKAHYIEHLELNHWTLNDSARKFFSHHQFEYYNEKMWKAI